MTASDDDRARPVWLDVLIVVAMAIPFSCFIWWLRRFFPIVGGAP